jgi:hypothetical protein
MTLTTAGNLPSFADGTGQAIGDSLITTALAPDDWTSAGIFNGLLKNVSSFPLANMFGGGTLFIPQTLTGAISVPNTASGSAIAGFAVAGYGNTASTTVGAVGTFGFGGMSVDGSSAFGGNVVVSNAAQCAPQTSVVGYKSGFLVGMEIDVDLHLSGGVAPLGMSTIGLQILGGSTTAGGAGSLSTAQYIFALGNQVSPKIPWDRGLVIDNSAATTAISIGAQAVQGASVDGQVVGFAAY